MLNISASAYVHKISYIYFAEEKKKKKKVHAIFGISKNIHIFVLESCFPFSEHFVKSY